MPFLASIPDDTAAPVVWSLHPEAYSAWPDMAAAVMASPSELTLGEKELIGSYSSALRGCTHCYTAHYPVAVAYGIDPEVFAHLMDDPRKAPVSDKLRAVLIYVHKLCASPEGFGSHETAPVGPGGEDINAILAQGWSRQTITDTAMICGMFGFMNTLMMGHGADKADLSDLGPLHAIIRTRGQYGHGKDTGRENPMRLAGQSIAKYGLVKTLKALRRARQLRRAAKAAGWNER